MAHFIRDNAKINDGLYVTPTRQLNYPLLDIKRGLNINQKSVSVRGRNDAVGTSLEDLWTTGGNYNWLNTAVQLDVVSLNVEDSVTGNGAQKVIIEGLGSTFLELSEEVTCNGVGANTTVNSFFRVNKVRVSKVGKYHSSNFNNITIQSNVDGLVLAVIGGGFGGSADTFEYGVGESQLGNYSVPAGKTGYLMEFEAAVESGKTAAIDILHCDNIDKISSNNSSRTQIFLLDGIAGFLTHEFLSPIKLPGPSDVWVRVSGSATAKISAEYSLVLIDN